MQKVPPILWGNWKAKIQECETIIISDGAYFPAIIPYIKSENPKCKILFYYMNPISSFTQKYLSIKNIKKVFSSDIYTYSFEDSEKYGLKWNPLHCYKLDRRNNKPKGSDFLFLGRDKGRAGELIQFYSRFKDTYTFNIKLVGSTGELGCKSKVEYEDYIQDVYSTKALIEVVDKEVKSYTFRVVEAAIYGRKLITNNYALKELPIYKIIKDNTLFVNYAEVDRKEIDKFMQSPIVEIEHAEKKSLGVDHWINCFH